MIWKLATVVVAGLMPFACSSAANADDPISALPEIATLRPVIACVGEHIRTSDELQVWSGGAPQGPAQSRETLEQCAPGADFVSDQPEDRNRAETYRRSVLFWALMAFGDRRDYLTVEDFDYAMGLARCVESKVIDDRAFKTRAPEEIHPVEQRALIACIPGFADMAADPERVLSRRDGLAFSIARLNLNYIYAQNGASRKVSGND